MIDKPPFEKYLVMVGYRAEKYNYSHYLILDHIEYFKKCYDENKGVYTALGEFKEYLGYEL